MTKAMKLVNKWIHGEKYSVYPLMQEHAIEFANWLAINYRPTTASSELKYWQKDNYQNKEYFYSTEELYKIFNNQTQTNE